MTDEQVLAYLAHFGSMSEATAHGDVALIADSDEQPMHTRFATERTFRRLKLEDYLREGEEEDGTN